MTPGNAGHGTHREIWELLPWYVTACLADRERERVEAHVKACAECRVELAQQRQLHRAMDVDSAVEHMPARSLQKLQQRLDAATVIQIPTDLIVRGGFGKGGIGQQLLCLFDYNMKASTTWSKKSV